VSAKDSLAELFPGRFYHAVTLDKAANDRQPRSSFPAVVCCPIHYATPNDRLKFNIVQSIRTRTLLAQEHPGKILAGDFHFRAPAELADLFSGQPALLARTIELAERCAFEMPFGKPQFPNFKPPDDSSPREFLSRLVFEGLRERYSSSSEKLVAQVREELAMIAEVGYEEYFLVVWDILQECQRRGIEWITRGSAADSLVCYCLRISDVCPIRFDLYFRRFLNRERMALNKLPDIDVDFAHDRKDAVVDLIFEKYGAANVAVVGGFSTYRARAAVADVGKVLGVSEQQIRRFTEHIPWANPTGLSERLKQNIECQDMPLEEEPYKTAVEMAGFLDGFPRHPKMHPCGVVLSRQPMLELTPTFVANKGYPTTHFEMEAVEAIGLIKMDILAQGGLAALRDARATLAARGIEIDLGQLEPWEDPQVWDLIANGGARAVHHIESPAMLSLCQMCNVRDIDGLVAIVSVIRPGAASQCKKLQFTRRYQGFEPVTYPHPSLEACLKSTFGLVVYEEHILQICEAFAGLAPGRADVLRRALAKEKQAVIDEIGLEFFSAARMRGHAEETIAEVWGLVRGFAGYAFCRAHSTAYGVEAYQSAWLKRYYPVDFMAAVLSNGKGFYHPLVYVLECHRLGIGLLPPSINQPGPRFEPCGSSIRAPLTKLKGLSERTKTALLDEHERGRFKSLEDFYRRVFPSGEEIESMVRVGAFDEFGESRTRQFWRTQVLQRSFGNLAEPGQGWLLPPPGLDRLPETPLDEPTLRERLEWETDLLGFAVSAHPLKLYDGTAWDTYCPVSRLGEHIGQKVVACGLIIEQRTFHQVTGEPMKFLTLADWTGMVETEMFALTYRSYGLAVVRYPVLEVSATVEPFENGRGFSLRVLRAGQPRRRM
jgi:DNA-directed DNA polymerase III PolC